MEDDPDILEDDIDKFMMPGHDISHDWSYLGISTKSCSKHGQGSSSRCNTAITGGVASLPC